MKINVVLAEDNQFLAETMREKLSFFAEINYKFRAKNGAELLDMLRVDHNIDVVLMDIQMPIIDGIEATELVKNRYPQIKIIVITVFDDNDTIFNAIKAGADGYLLKETGPKDLFLGIQDVLNGGAPMSPAIALKTLNLLRFSKIPAFEQQSKNQVALTKREVEILEHLATGLNYQLIAENLFISPPTVRKHLENIYRKLQVHNKMEAVQKAKKQNII